MSKFALEEALDKDHIFLLFCSNPLPCKECMLLAFQHPLAIFELKTTSQIFIFGSRIFVGGSETRQFLCACKQYLLTGNSSDGGLGRIFWIADIPMSSPPILSDLCSPSLRICPSMPSKSQSQPLKFITLQASS